MFVQAVDNRFYKNPTIEYPGVLIKFEDIEQPSIMIKYPSVRTSITSIRRKILSLLKLLNITAIVDTTGIEDNFAFPPDYRGLHKGAIFNFNLLSKLPIPNKYDSVAEIPSSRDSWLAFDVMVPYQHLLEIYNGINKISFVVKLLLINSDEYNLDLLKKEIKRQYPEIENIRPASGLVKIIKPVQRKKNEIRKDLTDNLATL